MKYSTLLATALLATSPVFAASGELKTQARQILAAHQDAIVGLSIIAKIDIGVDGDSGLGVKASGSGDGKDKKIETSGVVVDLAGLIVSSLGSIGGGSMMDGREIETPKGTVKLKAKLDIKEVKVVMPDGTEIPADVVLKDPDLDLVFFKIRSDSPEAKDVTFKAVDLKNNTAAEVLDDVVVLGRMDATMNRQPTAFTTEVNGIVRKPREFLSIPGVRPASPVFSPEGKLVGLAIMRKGTGAVAAGSAPAVIAAVLPARDVLKIADQARTAKPEKAGDSTENPESK